MVEKKVKKDFPQTSYKYIPLDPLEMKAEKLTQQSSSFHLNHTKVLC